MIPLVLKSYIECQRDLVLGTGLAIYVTHTSPCFWLVKSEPVGWSVGKIWFLFQVGRPESGKGQSVLNVSISQISPFPGSPEVSLSTAYQTF